MSEAELMELITKSLGNPGAAAVANDPYTVAKAEFATIPKRKGASAVDVATSAIRGLAGFTEAKEPGRGEKLPFVESATGKIMYDNGAIYDPASGRTLYPPDSKTQATIQGSNAWLRDVQDRWSDDKVAEWRKKLANQGYQVVEKGGWGKDLVDALALYHDTRYANFGKAIPLAPGAKAGGEGAVSIRETFDKKALKQQTKGWGYDVFGEDLDDDEAEFFADRILDVAQKLARKHKGEWTTEQIHAGAEMRVQKEFAKDPAVSDALEEAEELEGDTAIRDSIISVSQLGGI